MLTKMKAESFNAVFRIMEESFPLDEYRTYDEQKALLGDEHYEIYVLNDKSGMPEGFIAIWRFTEFTFIEHLAVSREYRSGGIGSSILKQISELFPGIFCLEVEPPETDISKRRIAFYERNGFSLNYYPYIQPSLSRGRKEIELMIMTTGGEITESTFRHYKSILYKYVYRIQN